jgi:hypothetical protein
MISCAQVSPNNVTQYGIVFDKQDTCTRHA